VMCAWSPGSFGIAFGTRIIRARASGHPDSGFVGARPHAFGTRSVTHRDMATQRGPMRGPNGCKEMLWDTIFYGNDEYFKKSQNLVDVRRFLM